MASDSQQLTLTGEETDSRRVPPTTMVYCRDCGERILRSEWTDHKVRPLGSTGGVHDGE